jgi:sphingomyelin phosphodiesterase acid-like 3
MRFIASIMKQHGRNIAAIHLSPSQLRGAFLKLLRSLPLLLLAAAAHAAVTNTQNVPVVMLSDIHFDPFHDPGKVSQLISAPAAQWLAILSAPDTPTAAADFTALQKICKAKGIDTPFALLISSLQAEHAQQPHPAFVTVSGDLLVHKFDCRFQQLAPKATEADYSAFAAKTVQFVALELHATFPQSPVYFALGNNDSGCGDYKEDPNSKFLQADAQSFAADVDKPNSKALLSEFAREGDYNALLPAPFHDTHLLVLQDIFESKRYTACSNVKNPRAEAEQIAWLRAQLQFARAHHEHVWIMAHIPPGVDAYSTLTDGQDVCAGKPPEMFLDSSAFADTITEFPDVIRLVLLGHTHNDEMRIYSSALGKVPGKLVPSITPVNGNNPAFTVAEVNPTTATLADYEVISASNQTAIDTKWSEEYRFSTTYKLPDFSAASAAKLLADFSTDKSGTSAASDAYERFYFVGGPGVAASLKAAAMHLIWPAYACSITQTTESDFRRCMCPASPPAAR